MSAAELVECLLCGVEVAVGYPDGGCEVHDDPCVGLICPQSGHPADMDMAEWKRRLGLVGGATSMVPAETDDLEVLALRERRRGIMARRESQKAALREDERL